MKKIYLIVILFIISINLYSQNITFENFVVKRKTEMFRRDTYYIGQVKSRTAFTELISLFTYENIKEYGGYKNVFKLYDENIDLYFNETEVFTLIEIKIKTDEYELYKSLIKVGDNIDTIIKTYPNWFVNYNDERKFYFAELEDFTNEFEDSVFYNISLQVENNIIKNIILYYSFAL